MRSAGAATAVEGDSNAHWLCWELEFKIPGRVRPRVASDSDLGAPDSAADPSGGGNLSLLRGLGRGCRSHFAGAKREP